MFRRISDENQVLEMKENVNDEWKCDPCKLKFVDKDR